MNKKKKNDIKQKLLKNTVFGTLGAISGAMSLSAPISLATGLLSSKLKRNGQSASTLGKSVDKFMRNPRNSAYLGAAIGGTSGVIGANKSNEKMDKGGLGKEILRGIKQGASGAELGAAIGMPISVYLALLAKGRKNLTVRDIVKNMKGGIYAGAIVGGGLGIRSANKKSKIIAKKNSIAKNRSKNIANKNASAIEMLFGKEAAETYNGYVGTSNADIFEKVAEANNITVEESVVLLDKLAVAFEDAEMKKAAANEVFEAASAEEAAVVQILEELGFDMSSL